MKLEIIEVNLGSRAVLMEASRWSIFALCLKRAIGALLVKCQIPGLVQNMKLIDTITGHSIEIKTSPLFTVLNVNGRDYYFKRFTGKFDGTGMGCHDTKD